MSTYPMGADDSTSAAAGRTGRSAVARRLTTETKSAYKTTEMMAFVAMVAAVLIAAAVSDTRGPGELGANDAWRYVTFLTIGYMISRGLAKSGSRERYSEENDGV